MVVDSHTHVIADDRERYPLKPAGLQQLGSGGGRPADWFETHAVSVEGLRDEMTKVGVDRAVLVQAMGAYGDDNSYCADAAAAHPGSTTSVCIVDAEAEDAPDRLEYWVGERGMRGVRLFAIGPADGAWLGERSGRALFESAGDLGIPVVVTIFSHQIPMLMELLSSFPDVPVALDHCGFPDLREGPPYPAAGPLFGLAGHESLHLKVSGLILSQIEGGGGRPRNFVRRLVSEFGARRLLWGSDYPQTHDRGYAEIVALCRDAAADLSEDERRSYLGGTALALWPELGG